MAEYKRFGKFGGGNKGGFKKSAGRVRFGGRPDFNREGGGRNDDARPQMFNSICATCNKRCEVPFRPNGEKPVYCKDCFNSARGEDIHGKSVREGESRGYPKQNFSPSFSTKGVMHTPDKRIDDLKKQVEAMNAKLDTLITMVREASM